MAVKLEFSSIIVPIAKIQLKCFPGMFRDCYTKIFPPCWYDEHLIRYGSMDNDGILDIIAEFADLGLKPIENVKGEEHWKDLCLVDCYKGPTYPCSWLEFDPEEHIVWLKGEPKGPIIGPSDRDAMEGYKFDL